MSSSSHADDPQARSGGGPPLVAYAATLVVYIVLGFFLKSVVLNWIVGPLFLLLALYLLPRLIRSVPSKNAG